MKPPSAKSAKHPRTKSACSTECSSIVLTHVLSHVPKQEDSNKVHVHKLATDNEICRLVHAACKCCAELQRQCPGTIPNTKHLLKAQTRGHTVQVIASADWRPSCSTRYWRWWWWGFNRFFLRSNVGHADVLLANKAIVTLVWRISVCTGRNTVRTHPK